MKAPPQAVRCAIDTRVSTESRLDRSSTHWTRHTRPPTPLNKSQAHAGWTRISSRYDDGGYSGGSPNRPDLQRLRTISGPEAIDVIVVYKVDRLTRSLADPFAKLVELFDAHGVSFVSVTQQFKPPDLDGQADPQRAPVLCPVRTGGHLGADQRQDRGLQAQGPWGRSTPARL